MNDCSLSLEIGLYVAIGGEVARPYQWDKRIVTNLHEPGRLCAYLLDDR